MTGRQVRYRIEYDDFGTDPGDWLPADAEHYDKVGPFRGNPDDWRDTDDTRFRDLTAAEWFSRPDSDIDNWVSFVLILEVSCDLGHFHPAASLGGLDFLDHGYGTPPFRGAYTADELPDDYLREVAAELLHEYQADEG